MKTLRSSAAFSLLELLVVLAIISILLAVLYPSYRQHLLKMHRAQAKVDLVAIGHRLEHFYTLQHSYAKATLATLDFAPAQQYYHYALEAEDEYYKISAIPQGSQQQDACGTLTYDAAGKKSAASENQQECW